MFKHISKKIQSTVIGLLIGTAVSASSIDTIDIHVVIDSLGTGHISERWVASVDDGMTEWYLSMKNLGNMSIQDFKVYDNDKQLYLQDDTPWDVDRSRYQKAGKAGIHEISDGKELCWGVGQSGYHCWTAEYKLVGLVRKYDDGCGFNHCFINYGLSSGPLYTRTTISMADSTPLSVDNARIWAFRYHGTCKFTDGKVVAENTEPLTTDNSMVVMCLFPEKDFATPNVIQDSIGTMKWRALEGSDYLEHYSDEDYANGNNVLFKNNEDQDLTWWETILMLLLCVLGYAFMIVISMVMQSGTIFAFVVAWNIISLRPLRIYLKQKKLLGGDITPNYFRGVPAKGDLNRAFYIIDENNYRFFPTNKDNLIAAYIVRLMRYKAITITLTEEKGKMVHRMKIAENWEFKDVDEENADIKCMKKLLEIMNLAAGGNLILEKGELKKFFRKDTSKTKELLKIIEREDFADATPTEYQEVMGLKRFLKDFSQIETRGALEVELWDEYLVYAALYGISDQVIKDFKSYCPEYFRLSAIGSQLVDNSGCIISDFSSYTGISSVSHSFSSAISPRYGGGGSSSGGGGGGHSGGGGGGGGR